MNSTINEKFIKVKVLCMKRAEEFDSVLRRLKETVSLGSDSDLAKLLGMSPQAFNNRKRAGSIPATEIVGVCNGRGIDLNYVFRGETRIEHDVLLAAIAYLQGWQAEEQCVLPKEKFMEALFLLVDIAEGVPTRIQSVGDKVVRLAA